MSLLRSRDLKRRPAAGTAIGFVPAPLSASAAAGAAVGRLTSSLAGAAWSVLSGAVAVASDGAVTLTSPAPSSGALTFRVRAQTSTDAVETTVSVPVTAASTGGAAPAASLLPYGARVAMIGDSIVQFNMANASSSQDNEGVTTQSVGELSAAQARDPRFRCETWHDVTVTTPAGGARYFKGADCGVSSEQSAAGLSRFDADVTARRPDVVVIAEGTNNLAGASSTAAADCLAMADKALAAGLLPIVCTIRPWVSGGLNDSASKQAAFQGQNAAIRAGVASRRSQGAAVLLCDLAAAYGAPDSWVSADPSLFNDGLHPSPKGADIGAEALGAVLAQAIAPGNVALDLWTGGANLLADSVARFTGAPLTTSTAKNGSGVVAGGQYATGWTPVDQSACTAACSLEANADTGGMTQVLTVTPGGTAADALIAVGVSSLPTSGVSAGDWLQGFAEVEFDDWPAWEGATFVFAPKGGNYLNQATAMQIGTGKTRRPVAGRRWLLTPPMRVFSGLTAPTFGQVTVNLYLNPNGASGQGVFKVRRAWVGKVADPRVAWNAG